MKFFYFFKKKETRAAELAVEDEALCKLLISPDALTKEKALSIPAVASCVEFIAGTIAMLPVKLYKEMKSSDQTEEIGQTKEIRNDVRLRLLNDETGDLLDAFQMKKALIRDYLLGGCGYLYINRQYNSVVSLHYVDCGKISVSLGADPIFKRAEIYVNGIPHYPFEFVTVTRNTIDGVTGRGIIAENREILATMYNTIVFEEELLKKGGNRKGFLTSERKLGTEEMDYLREKWEALYNSHSSGVMILNNGVKFQEASATAVEMQLDENKRTNSGYICGLFNLSPDVVNGKATEEQYSAAVKPAILPVLSAIQTALNKSLLLESEKDSYYFAVDTSELLKGDILMRYQAYQIALQSNFLQPDEVRYKEDLAPLGLDFIKLGLNDVLYDPKTKQVYTPNTNQTSKIDGENAGNPLTNPGKGDILDLRFNPYHDPVNGKFTSGNSGAFGNINAELTKGTGGGIISLESGNLEQAKTRDKKIVITDIAISKVSPPIISNFSDEQNTKFQELHKELLRVAKEENDSNEVAFLFNPSTLEYEKELGGLSSVNIFLNPIARDMYRNSSESELYLLHNHPSTKTFSYSDLGVLLLNENLGGITVVTNAGHTEVLRKTENYDFDTAYRFLKEIRSEYKGKVLTETQDAEIARRFIKAGKKYGITIL